MLELVVWKRVTFSACGLNPDFQGWAWETSQEGGVPASNRGCTYRHCASTTHSPSFPSPQLAIETLRNGLGGKGKGGWIECFSSRWKI